MVKQYYNGSSRNIMEGLVLESSGSGHCPVTGCYEQSNEPSGFIKSWDILEQLSMCKLSKQGCALWSWRDLLVVACVFFFLYFISFRLVGSLSVFLLPFLMLSSLQCIFFYIFYFPFNCNFSSVLFLSIPLLARSTPCIISYCMVTWHSDAIVIINNGLETPLKDEECSYALLVCLIFHQCAFFIMFIFYYIAPYCRALAQRFLVI